MCTSNAIVRASLVVEMILAAGESAIAMEDAKIHESRYCPRRRYYIAQSGPGTQQKVR